MGSARPVRRFNALRAHSRQAFRRPKSPEAPLALSHPFRGLPSRSRKAPPARRPACQTLLPLLNFDSLRHTRGAVDPFAVRGSRRERVPSPGFGYPHLGVHHRPYRRAKRRSALGLLPSRRSPRRGRHPSRGPCPLGVATVDRTGGYDCTRPTSGPRSRDELVRSSGSEEPDRRCLPGIHPSRAFSPSVRACALVALPALPPIWRGDVPARPGLRASRSGWIGLSVSGLPALLGFSTFRLSRRSVRRVGGRAHGFTSREMPGVYGTARS